MRNPLILLDAGGAFLLIIPVVMILFMVAIIFLEGWILFAFGYNVFKRCLRDAMLANIVSLVLGMITMSLAGSTFMNGYVLFGILFLITLISEGLFLVLINKEQPFKKIILANLVMNVASYVLLGLILFAIR